MYVWISHLVKLWTTNNTIFIRKGKWCFWHTVLLVTFATNKWKTWLNQRWEVFLGGSFSQLRLTISWFNISFVLSFYHCKDHSVKVTAVCMHWGLHDSIRSMYYFEVSVYEVGMWFLVPTGLLNHPGPETTWWPYIHSHYSSTTLTLSTLMWFPVQAAMWPPNGYTLCRDEVWMGCCATAMAACQIQSAYVIKPKRQSWGFYMWTVSLAYFCHDDIILLPWFCKRRHMVAMD